MPNYKLLALDLDRTLLNKEKEISAENKYWIEKAKQAGVHVIFSTGRGIQRTEHLRKELQLEGPQVLLNGADVWEAPGKLLRRTYMDDAAITYMYERAAQSKAKIWSYDVESITHYRNPKEMKPKLGLLKLGISHKEPEVIDELRDDFNHLETITITDSRETNLEISAKNVTKASGVRLVLEKLDLDFADVMAVGDSNNDFYLVQEAGLGVAVGNAAATLKEVADEVTATHDNHGVAQAIKRYIFSIDD